MANLLILIIINRYILYIYLFNKIIEIGFCKGDSHFYWNFGTISKCSWNGIYVYKFCRPFWVIHRWNVWHNSRWHILLNLENNYKNKPWNCWSIFFFHNSMADKIVSLFCERIDLIMRLHFLSLSSPNLTPLFDSILRLFNGYPIGTCIVISIFDSSFW